VTGRLIGIARRAERRAPMEEIASGSITRAAGLAGDFKGAKYPLRQITLLSREAWEAALLDLRDLVGVPPIPWTARRANLLLEGIALPRGKGARLRVGEVLLEVTGVTWPCRRMDEVHAGLLKALAHDARGGVTCTVGGDGEINLGDPIVVLFDPPVRTVRLPG